ncbi:hypothetical protein Tcan_06402, partial [Toxocara canis]
LALLELEAEEENARRQEETVKPVDNERFSDTTHSRLGSTSAAESQPFMNSDDSSVPNVSVEEGNAIIKEREPISNDKDNPKVEEGITTEAGESRPPRRIYRRKKDGCGYTAISRPWLYALLLSIFISILASWVTHLNIGVEPNWERRLVLNSIRSQSSSDELELLPVWSSTAHERVSKWTGSSAFTQAAPTRICSSANCLNQDIVEEGSTHSQALSEPADPKTDVQRNEKCVEGQSRKRERQIVEATKDSLASDASRPTATAKASKDVISEEGEREEWMVDESEDSNTFNSEEEDSEEERLFNEMVSSAFFSLPTPCLVDFTCLSIFPSLK